MAAFPVYDIYAEIIQGQGLCDSCKCHNILPAGLKLFFFGNLVIDIRHPDNDMPVIFTVRLDRFHPVKHRFPFHHNAKDHRKYLPRLQNIKQRIPLQG